MRLALPACLLSAVMVLAPSVSATWSIVVYDARTGEVAVASATCLETLDLRRFVPVVVVGKGAAAAQSQIDTGAQNRQKIWDFLQEGELTGHEIVQVLKAEDFFSCSKQYGIVNSIPSRKTWTGACASPWKGGLQGNVDGEVWYAVQGNILTGEPVVTECLEAVLNTPGRLADRLMAGMQAARAMGGDGRCSCPDQGATACGAPPVNGFEKSAHIGFMIVARIGDTDGVCNAIQGCANGDYWMNINAVGALDDPDPVDTLQAQYDAFLASMAGEPDGLLSQGVLDSDEVLGDGVSQRVLQVALYDLDGQPITSGGHLVSVTHAEGSAGLGTPGDVIDNGDGTYTVTVTAGRGTGVDAYAVRIDSGEVSATLYPYPTLRHRAALETVEAEPLLSATTGGSIELSLQAPDALAGRRVTMALSLAGTEPGFQLPSGVVLPLNPDALLLSQQGLIRRGVLAGIPTALDDLGRATARLELGGEMAGVVDGAALSAAWFTANPVDYASNAVTIPVGP